MPTPGKSNWSLGFPARGPYLSPKPKLVPTLVKNPWGSYYYGTVKPKFATAYIFNLELNYFYIFNNQNNDNY